MIINATPHHVNIYRKEDCKYDESQRKWFVKTGAKPVVTIESSGKLLNVHIELHISEITDEGIPIFYEDFVSVDHPASQFPQYEAGDIIVVSRQYAEVAAKRYPGYRFACISQPVYDDPKNPRPVGCLGLVIVS